MLPEAKKKNRPKPAEKEGAGRFLAYIPGYGMKNPGSLDSKGFRAAVK